MGDTEKDDDAEMERNRERTKHVLGLLLAIVLSLIVLVLLVISAFRLAIKVAQSQPTPPSSPLSPVTETEAGRTVRSGAAQTEDEHSGLTALRVRSRPQLTMQQNVAKFDILPDPKFCRQCRSLSKDSADLLSADAVDSKSGSEMPPVLPFPTASK